MGNYKNNNNNNKRVTANPVDVSITDFRKRKNKEYINWIVDLEVAGLEKINGMDGVVVMLLMFIIDVNLFRVCLCL